MNTTQIQKQLTEKIERLKGIAPSIAEDIERLVGELVEHNKKLETQLAGVVKLGVKTQTKLERVRPYLNHKGDCICHIPQGDTDTTVYPDCDCGLKEALLESE